MIRMQIQLTESQVQAFKRIAASKQISVIKSTSMIDPEERYRRATDLVRKLIS